jgi:hypothetical protein
MRYGALILVGLLFAGADGVTAATPPPIILILTLDTTRADHLSLYGYGRPTTPALAEVAHRGVVVRRAITPMPMTTRRMSPSAGLRRTHGVPEQHELADRRSPHSPLGAASVSHGRVRVACAPASERGPLPASSMRTASRSRSGSAATRSLRQAWLRAHRDERLFVWVHLFGPHAPYRRPSRTGDLGAHDPQPVLLETKAPTRLRRGSGNEPSLRCTMARSPTPTACRPADRPAHSSPAGQAPLVVVTGDHGEMLAERDVSHRYAFDHGQLLFQEVLEVPLVLRWDSVLPAGRVLDGPVSLVDVAPTLFELLGDPGFPTQGRSLVPEIDGREPPGTRLAFTERRLLSPGKRMRWLSWSQFSVQDRRYKADPVDAVLAHGAVRPDEGPGRDDGRGEHAAGGGSRVARGAGGVVGRAARRWQLECCDPAGQGEGAACPRIRRMTRSCDHRTVSEGNGHRWRPDVAITA